MAKAGKAETEHAIAAAERAFPAWHAQTAKARSEILYRWYQLMIEHKAWLAQLMTAEQGKPFKEAEGEWNTPRALFSGLQNRRSGPIGVVAAITPWNFPMAMLTAQTGSGAGGGLHHHYQAGEQHAAERVRAAEAGERACQTRMLNAVTGDTHAISDAIIASKAVRKISFTGSTQVGKTLVRNVADTMKKVSMELGGNAPYIVFENADIDAAVKGAIASKFRNAGQVCVSVNRFYILYSRCRLRSLRRAAG